MKISEARKLVVGDIVANKINHYRVVNINMENGKAVSFDLEGIFAQLNTNALNRTVKIQSMKSYEVAELPEEY